MNQPYPLELSYIVGDDGVIYRNGKQLKQSLDHKGYKRITLRIGGKIKAGLVHRIVARTFLGESDLTVDHIDGDKTNNHISNLRYLDRLTNAKIGRNRWHLKRMFEPSELDKQLAAATFAEAGFTSRQISGLFSEKKHNVEAWLHRFRKMNVLSRKYRHRV